MGQSTRSYYGWALWSCRDADLHVDLDQKTNAALVALLLLLLLLNNKLQDLCVIVRQGIMMLLGEGSAHLLFLLIGACHVNMHVQALLHQILPAGLQPKEQVAGMLEQPRKYFACPILMC